MIKRKVFFPSYDGTYQLCGVLTYPAGDPRHYGYMSHPTSPRFRRPGFPVAVLLSGWRGNKDSKRSVGIAKELAAAGIASFRLDFQGHGESEGDIRRASVTSEMRDTYAAIKFLETRRKVDFQFGCAIAGASVGGSVALLAMAQFGQECNLKTGVLVSCRSDYHADLKPGTYSFTDQATGERMVNRVMMRSGRNWNFYGQSGMVTAPVLVLHGTADKTVPFRQSQRLVEGRSNFQLVPIKGGDHVLRGGFNDQVVEQASRFVITHLQPKG